MGLFALVCLVGDEMKPSEMKALEGFWPVGGTG